MIIKSSFKDYYDFIAHSYGGGDPRVVYVRDRITPRVAQGLSYLSVDMGRFPMCDPVTWPSINADYSLAYLVCCGKAYLLSRDKDHHWTEAVNSWKLRDPKTVIDFSRYYQRSFGSGKFDLEFEKEYPFLVELSRKVGAPVFVIMQVTGGTSNTVTVAGQCPILHELGMAAHIPAAQMYQDLAYFMGNTIKLSPDTAPPVEISNQDKIVAAGFDLKQSFRHRM